MAELLPTWVQDAATLPVAFAQVREDPLLDQWLVERLGPNARILMIASGGCTAALLATLPNVGLLHLVDANPAQLALTRLKLHLLRHGDAAERMALLGHATMPVVDRAGRLAELLETLHLPANALGPLDQVATLGPDYAGRYEQCFAALQRALSDQADSLEDLLRLRDPQEQARRVSENTVLRRLLDSALDDVLALPNLVRLFGAEATKNPVEPFSRHFARRIFWALATSPAAENPYLWQMLLGRYPDDCAAPWLTVNRVAKLPEIHWTNLFMADALREVREPYDFVHLSNILDWLTPEQASETLALAAQALRPGGWTLIRQLNSSLDVQSLGPLFVWQTHEADQLYGRDRSFFYRQLHLGRKR